MVRIDSEKIKIALAEMGLTLAAFSKIAGVSLSTAQKITARDTPAPTQLRTLGKLAKALKVSPTALIATNKKYRH